MPDYIQGSNQVVRDYIFPIITAKQISNDEIKLTGFLGTGFLIGKRGFAITAYHTVENFHKNWDALFENKEGIGVLFIDNKNKFISLSIDSIEPHPTEDIAILHIKNNNYSWQTPFRISNKKEFGWKDFFLGGYPDDVVWEKEVITTEGKIILARPDLVSVKGYVRRNFSENLNIKGIKGNSFYELNAIAGKGCSGSPVYECKNGIWNVFGVYTAEKEIFKGEIGEQYVSMQVSYAVRTESFFDWNPSIFQNNKSVFDESLDSII